MSKFVEKVGLSAPKNNPIDLSHTLHTSFDMMQFKVLLIEEMLPKDQFNIKVNAYTRVSPLSHPVYGDITVKTSAFFVPVRILWKNWQKFLTGGTSGNLTAQVPKINVGDLYNKYNNLKSNSQSFDSHLIRNFLTDAGLPNSFFDNDTIPSSSVGISELPFRAIRRVWWDWYRDSNLIGDDLEDSYCFTDDGTHIVQTVSQPYSAGCLYHPMPTPFAKDYFTTAFVEPQRGEDSLVSVNVASSDLNSGLAGRGSAASVFINGPSGSDSTQIWANGNSQTNANSVLGQFKINAFRAANALQQYLERNNIAGANALQQLLAHWGTAPNPAVFNRSTYIGSDLSHLNIDEVTSLSNTVNGNNGSELGQTSTKMNGSIGGDFSYTANEHGYFIIVQICRPETGYPDGLRRALTRFDRYDYFTPEMENTGFQPLYRRELYFGNDSDVTNVFGYVPRYAEYKYTPNRVSSDYGLPTMKSYHLNRDLSTMANAGNLGSISTNFTAAVGPTNYNGCEFDRIFSDTNNDFDHFLEVVRFDFKANRPMHGFSVPTIADIQGSDTVLPYAGVRL